MLHGSRSMAVILSSVVLLAVCGGCSLFEEGTMYDVGIKAVKADPAFPKNAVPAAKDKCKFFINKNAACIETPYSVSGATPAKGQYYIVWLKLIGDRWDLDRCLPALPTSGREQAGLPAPSRAAEGPSRTPVQNKPGK